MISFESDYICGAHPLILEKLKETNMEPLSGYGSDVYTKTAKEKIKAAIGFDVDVEFIVGGTQTNAVVISTMLKDYQGVIAAKTGHINAHEAGAIEFFGKKVLELPQHNGKIDPKELKSYLDTYFSDENREHMTYPGMVYISHPTEYGTLYTKQELTEISDICQSNGIILYMDGARLGYGLASNNTDVTLKDVATLCDVFYIGGTKVGALCGEAIVFTKNNKPEHFLTSIKKRGALIAKGRLLGIQFDTLFTNDLYFKISKHAIDMAEKLKIIINKYELKFYIPSDTNQQFVIIDNKLLAKLKEKVSVSFWEKYDESNTVVRFATSWSTTDNDLIYLDNTLKEIIN